MTPSPRPAVDSVNLAVPAPNPYKESLRTGIAKRPVDRAVTVTDPGPDSRGTSGLEGDMIGDAKHHGGHDAAVYAFAREDLDEWERRLGRPLGNGSFGENLTTVGVGVNEAVVGERWRIGDTLLLQVTAPRIPCSTFRGSIGEPGWVTTFTEAGRPGSYLRVVTGGPVRAGDPVTVVHRPDHGVTVAAVFRAVLTDPASRPAVLAAGEDLTADLRAWLVR